MARRLHLRPLAQQVIVITGASSGIGLVTARMAAAEGARLLLVARNGEALAAIAEELRMDGADVDFVVADVGIEEDVEKVVRTAITRFGGFDTWVNAAAVAIYGFLDQVTMSDHRKLFETNYWGVVYGSLAAARHLRERGGAIVTVGSVLSEIAVPLQGPYVASKHAVKGFVDSLRIDLEAEGAPISLTLIKPTSIDTPYLDHAKNYLDREPKTPPPRYAPELVARAILYAARHPRRELYVGGAGKAMVLLQRFFPAMFDTVQATFWSGQQTRSTPNPGETDTHDNLRGPKRDGEERGSAGLPTRELSLYTEAKLRPGAAMLLAGVALGAAYCLVQHSRTGRWPWEARREGWADWASNRFHGFDFSGLTSRLSHLAEDARERGAYLAATTGAAAAGAGSRFARTAGGAAADAGSRFARTAGGVAADAGSRLTRTATGAAYRLGEAAERGREILPDWAPGARRRSWFERTFL